MNTFTLQQLLVADVRAAATHATPSKGDANTQNDISFPQEWQHLNAQYEPPRPGERIVYA